MDYQLISNLKNTQFTEVLPIISCSDEAFIMDCFLKQQGKKPRTTAVKKKHGGGDDGGSRIKEYVKLKKADKTIKNR